MTIKEFGYQQRLERLTGLGFHLVEYHNWKTMMTVRCPGDHTFKIRPETFRKNPQCPTCLKTEKRTALEQKAALTAQDNGLTFHGIEENKYSQTLHVRISCPSGHSSSRASPSFFVDPRCRSCTQAENLNSQTVIAQDFIRRGFRLITNPVGFEQTLSAICPKGHKLETTYKAFRRTSSGGCVHPDCNVSKQLPSRVKQSFALHGYELLTEYKNAHAKMDVKCNRGHIFSTKWNRWSNGHFCPTCFATKKYALDEVREVYEAAGYVLLGDKYKNHYSKMLAVCPNKHEYAMSFKSFLTGRRCPRCQTNRPEAFLTEWLKSLGVDFLWRDRSTLEGIELDFHLPKQKLAIEYCGLYWHSIEYLPADYHVKKLEICRNAGIRLITLFEDEYLFDRDATMSRLQERIEKKERSPETCTLDRRWDHEDDWTARGYSVISILPPKKWYAKQQRRYTEKPAQLSFEIHDCGYAEVTK